MAYNHWHHPGQGQIHQMNQTEGVIKYRLDYRPDYQVSENLRELNVWRSILYGLRLIGQRADRYQGFGYGNLSARSQNNSSEFIISGTQTGHLGTLAQDHYVMVHDCNVAENRVIASGPVKPSSEALTHSMIYRLNPQIQCVIHIHDPVMWHFGLAADYPLTEKSIPYGSVEMAFEVERLYKTADLLRNQVLFMAGHEDGVVFLAETIEQAGLAVIKLWLLSHFPG